MSEPLCGDSTCESPSCRQEAIDAWHRRVERDAAEAVRLMVEDPEKYFREARAEAEAEATEYVRERLGKPRP